LCGACLRLICAAGACGASLDAIVAALPGVNREAVAETLHELEGSFDVYLKGDAYLPM
jgi:hypothetical protein